jgi:hypothetical protein
VEPIAFAFLNDHAEDTVGIAYHSWWPMANDPFYLHASADCGARIADYNVSLVPHLRLDGVTEPHFLYTYQRIQSAYDERKAVATSVSLGVSGSFSAASGHLDLEITALSDLPLPAGDYRIHAVLTESDILYSAPNGIDEHHHTLRRMLPGPAGSPVTFSAGPSIEATAMLETDLDPLYLPTACRIVYFLQEAVSLEVFQAGSVALSDLPEPTAVGRSSFSKVKSLY